MDNNIIYNTDDGAASVKHSLPEDGTAATNRINERRKCTKMEL